MSTNYKSYKPFVSPYDPCEPILEKTYSTPPHLYLGFQPPNLPQFSPLEALKKGTLWQPLYDPYYSPYERARE
ncbi:spore coat associated protein CotJA [Bacillus sp. FJAT-49736]|uniref:spore coat associated protein CotJA n=1 Tax=Bacillus sp. FJAT-49736 TaxID=2833582 RepID=UPI001BC97BCE|nr:spore coat associated protein CotJA [Bacillus sp. FJAT-49736]MBS4173306.1 spore coat associated protein CotJA [Bacillus sp. FJAT-49736]